LANLRLFLALFGLFLLPYLGFLRFRPRLASNPKNEVLPAKGN